MKKQFSVLSSFLNDSKGGFGGDFGFTKKQTTATERMPVNILSSDGNIVL
jgi:hypothetical protein